VAVTCGGKLKFAVVGTEPERPPAAVISGYVPVARAEPSTAIVGVPLKLMAPDTLSGASVVLGVTEPKLNSLVVVLSSKVKLAQVHCFVLSGIETPKVSPDCTSTALLAHEPPTTPTSLPPLIVVAPRRC
jgi:hypothetical protein